MTMRDAISDLKFGTALAGLFTTDQNLVVDLQGVNAVGFLVVRGVGGITFDASNKIEFVLEESDDNVTYTAVKQVHMLPRSGITINETTGVITELNLVAAHAAQSAKKLGYIGDKRYIRLTVEFTGTHGTGTQVSVVPVMTHAKIGPSA